MANNGKSVAATSETTIPREQVTQTWLPDEELTTKSRECMNLLNSIIDCPFTQMILKNSVHLLLELPEHRFDVKSMHQLLTDEKTRSISINTLLQETPSYWTEEWNSLWKKDVAPLLSLGQQRIAKRISLINFWDKEYATIPVEDRNRVANIVHSMF